MDIQNSIVFLNIRREESKNEILKKIPSKIASAIKYM